MERDATDDEQEDEQDLSGWQKIKAFGQNSEYHPLVLIVFSALSSILLYVPVYRKDPTVLFRYWDGPNYLYVARTLYDIPAQHPFVFYKTTPAYFACHLPLYPLLIRLFSYALGYPAAMLAVTLLCSGLATCLFYQLIKETQVVKYPFWSAIVFLFLPARWMIYHSVGSTEPLFLCLIFGSMLAWRRNKFWLVCLLLGLSSVTRIVGLLAALAYCLFLLHQKCWKSLPWLAIIPLPLLATFAFYQFRLGDFWAYFHWNAKLLHKIPLEVLGAYASNGDLHASELYLGLFLIYGVGVFMLRSQPLFFWYSLVFFTFNLFVFHEDLSRYFIPIAPFALIVAYDRVIASRAFQAAFPLLIYMVYIYSWAAVERNVMFPELWPQLLQVLQK